MILRHNQLVSSVKLVAYILQLYKQLKIHLSKLQSANIYLENSYNNENMIFKKNELITTLFNIVFILIKKICFLLSMTYIVHPVYVE